MNLKNKVISIRELILIGLLLILAAYYLVVQGPIAKQTQEYQTELMQINSELEMAQLKAKNKIEMQKAIDAIFEKYNGNPPMTPEYNNINYIIGELNSILGNTYDYNLAFDAETVDENNPNIIRRPMSITFSTRKYDNAVSKIKMINKSENKYLIQDVSISDEGSRRIGLTNQYGYRVGSTTKDGGKYDVVMTMTSFEYREEIPEPTAEEQP